MYVSVNSSQLIAAPLYCYEGGVRSVHCLMQAQVTHAVSASKGSQSYIRRAAKSGQCICGMIRGLVVCCDLLL